MTRHHAGDSAVHGASTAGDPYLPDSGNGGYRVTRYELDLTYRMSSNLLLGRARLSAVATQTLSRFSLDLHGMRVIKVVVNGRRARRFTGRGHKLRIWLAEDLPVGVAIAVDITYSGNPRPIRGRWGEVGWDELDDGALVASQPDGAPSWFPCNDHPSDKASYRMTITTDSPYRVVANGTLVDHTVHGSHTTWVYDQPEPMATYLASVQIGQYDVVTVAKKPVRQFAALPHQHRAQFDDRFGRQPAMMSAFDKLFGPFPFPQYTVVVTADDLEIPVEAQGMSIFGGDFLGAGEERLVAHELAHQWFGNSLTVAAWQHIWLNEGFACYAEWLWSEESDGPSASRLASRHHERLSALAQDLIVADPGAELMFDDRLYKRGALTLHALRRTVGDDTFFALLRDWTARFRHGIVTTEQFIAHAERHADVSLRALFTNWLYEAELPALPTGRRRH